MKKTAFLLSLLLLLTACSSPAPAETSSAGESGDTSSLVSSSEAAQSASSSSLVSEEPAGADSAATSSEQTGEVGYADFLDYAANNLAGLMNDFEGLQQELASDLNVASGSEWQARFVQTQAAILFGCEIIKGYDTSNLEEKYVPTHEKMLSCVEHISLYVNGVAESLTGFDTEKLAVALGHGETALTEFSEAYTLFAEAEAQE